MVIVSYENCGIASHIKILCICKFRFYAAYETDIQIRTFRVLSRFAGAMESLIQPLDACSCRYIMLIIAAVCALRNRNHEFLV